MSRFRRSLIWRDLTIWPSLVAILLALLWTVSCARPTGLHNPTADSAAPHQVPFHDGDSPEAPHQEDASKVENGLNSGSKSESELPFHDPELPAGTLLTVRLKSPIMAQNPGVNGTFEAAVADPVVIDGNKLIPRGTTVIGRVESARTSNLKRNRGNVRLVLDSIHLDGASLPIQTSSLFVRGREVASDTQGRPNARADSTALRGETAPRDVSQTAGGRIRLEKGRQLTFRLSEAVYVAASQRPKVDR